MSEQGRSLALTSPELARLEGEAATLGLTVYYREPLAPPLQADTMLVRGRKQIIVCKGSDVPAAEVALAQMLAAIGPTMQPEAVPA